MNDFKNEQDFEKALIEHLNSRELDKKSLNLISSYLVSAFKAGLILHDWHIIGQPPRIDELTISGTMKVNQSGSMSRLMDLKNWKDIKVFKVGIPFPDLMDVRMTFQPR